MSNVPARMTPKEQGALVREQADRLLVQMLGEEAGRKAGARVAVAYQTLVSRTPKMADCAPASVVQAVAMSALTGLYPSGVNPGCYVIPREVRANVDGQWRTVRTDLNWQVSATGLRQLARAAGCDVVPTVVYVTDSLTHADGSLDELSPTPPRLVRGARQPLAADADPLDAVAGVVVLARHVESMSTVGWMWIPVDIIRARREVSDAYARGAKRGATDRDRSSPWFMWPEEMALKTAVRYALTGARSIVPIADSTFALALEAEHEERPVVDVSPAREVRASAEKPSSALDALLEQASRDAEPEEGGAE